MRILVISATPWNTNNSFGNSHSNIFDGLPEYEYANLFCAEGVVNDKLISRSFQITPKSLLINTFNHNVSAGKEVAVVKTQSTGENLSSVDATILNFLKSHRLQVFFWIRDLIWKFGKWNDASLKNFVKDYSPDILLCPIYRNTYMNKICLAIQKSTNVPMLGYISDDNYTLNAFSFSPFFWIDRLIARRGVKKAIDKCSILYVISDIQKREYDEIFKKDSRILTKGKDFGISKPQIKDSQIPYQLVFAGNMGSNRWKSLEVIGQAIKKLNTNEIQMQLSIYSATPLTKNMSKRLNIPNCMRVMGRVTYSEIADIQNNADILVHVEPTDIQNAWGSHQGFSTKLVDYMFSRRPILAYGLESQASISHLKSKDAAFVASTPLELDNVLTQIINQPSLLLQYADKAWQCGSQYHDINKFHEMLRKDFNEVLNENSTN